MQIRIFNRQDDKGLRTLIEREKGLSLNLDNADKDLRNVEATYFGHGGIFLVAEDEGEVKAYMGARPLSDEALNKGPEVITITRLGKAPELSEKEGNDIMESLLKVVLNHAYQMDFRAVDSGQEMP